MQDQHGTAGNPVYGIRCEVCAGRQDPTTEPQMPGVPCTIAGSISIFMTAVKHEVRTTCCTPARAAHQWDGDCAVAEGAAQESDAPPVLVGKLGNERLHSTRCSKLDAPLECAAGWR